MEEKVEYKQPEQEVAKVPIGFTAKNNTTALVTMQQLFDLMRVVETLGSLTTFLKQENFNNDNIRYYFEEDIVEVENDKKEKVKQLREDFWN